MTNADLSEALERTYHRTRDRLGLGLHNFVKDGEEDVVRMRRRFHIHFVLLGCNGMLTYFSVVGIVSVTALTSVTTLVLVVQESIDRIGKF